MKAMCGQRVQDRGGERAALEMILCKGLLPFRRALEALDFFEDLGLAHCTTSEV